MNRATWYVLIEEDEQKYERLDTGGFYRHEWHLKASLHVDGDRDAAEAKAEELASHHTPDWIAKHLGPGGRPQRNVYRLPDGSRLVSVRRRYDETRFRVSIAELILTEEEIQPTYPEQPKKKGLFRR